MISFKLEKHKRKRRILNYMINAIFALTWCDWIWIHIRNQNNMMFEPLIKKKTIKIEKSTWCQDRFESSFFQEIFEKIHLKNCETRWFKIYLLNSRQFISKPWPKYAPLEIFFLTLYQFKWKNQMSDWCWFFTVKMLWCAFVYLPI